MHACLAIELHVFCDLFNVNMENIEQEGQKSEKSPTIAATTTTTTAAGAGAAAYTTATRFTEITEPEREQLQQQSEKSPMKFAANKSTTLGTPEQSNKIYAMQYNNSEYLLFRATNGRYCHICDSKS